MQPVLPIDRAATPADPALLDDVVWQALDGPHAALAQGDETARRYPPAVAPFGAVRPIGPAALAAVAASLAAGEALALVTTEPIDAVDGLVATLRASLDQMVHVDPAALVATPVDPIGRLTVADVPEMLRLTSATRPGPFGPRTIELGDYYGIRADGRLVAMGGERLRVPGYTEVSAICVDPEFRGRGYAAALLVKLATTIRGRGETPFLHVISENASAIALYERLGFRLRRRMHLAVWQKEAG